MASTKVSGRINYGTASIGAAAAQVLPAQPARSSVVVQNNHATQDLYIGGDLSVATTTGLHLKAGADITLNDYNGPVFAIASGAATDVRFFEVF